MRGRFRQPHTRASVHESLGHHDLEPVLLPALLIEARYLPPECLGLCRMPGSE
jgi:hypothetical protein